MYFEVLEQDSGMVVISALTTLLPKRASALESIATDMMMGIRIAVLIDDWPKSPKNPFGLSHKGR